MQQDEAWAEAATRLQTITGVGVITTAWLLTATLNFTLCPTPEAATAYAGLVPHPQHSGTSVAGHTGVGAIWACAVAQRALPGHPQCRAL